MLLVRVRFLVCCDNEVQIAEDERHESTRKREQLEFLHCHITTVPMQNAPIGRRTTDLTSIRRQVITHKRPEVDAASQEFNSKTIANYIARWTSPKLAGVRVRAHNNHDRCVLWKSCLSQQECAHVFPERSKIEGREWRPVEIYPVVNRPSPGDTEREVRKFLRVQTHIISVVDGVPHISAVINRVRWNL